MSTTTTATTSGAPSRRCRNTICQRRTRPGSSARMPGGSTRCKPLPASSVIASPRSSGRIGGRPRRRSVHRCAQRHRFAQQPPNRQTAPRSGVITMPSKDFTVFDSDSHVVEPPALWEKYLDPEYRTLGRHALWREEGRTGSYLKVNGEVFRDTTNPNLPRHALWRPGLSWDDIGSLDPHTRHE